MHYHTIVVSDIHLGTKNAKIKQLVHFLKENTCENLILNGDIIDGWQLKKRGKWKKKETKFVKLLLNKTIEDCKVIYLRGNHDDFLEDIIPFTFSPMFHIQRDYVLEYKDKSYIILHGDIFDTITSKMVWLSKMGDIGYILLLTINHYYNKIRRKKGLPYHSISQEIKLKVKKAVNFLFDFEKRAILFAKQKNMNGIICGHVHKPEIKEIDGCMYLNSGDWVESLSALVMDYDGNWSIKNVDLHDNNINF